MKRLMASLTLLFLLLTSTLSTAIAESLFPIHPAHTGSWFDPDDPGFGGFINIADVHGARVLVISWFDLNRDGEQFWLVGSSAPIERGVSSVVVPMFQTRERFDGKIKTFEWGTFSFEFTSCDTLRIFGNPKEDNVGGGWINLTRLTKIEGMSC
jgi:hypothetical protein